MYTNIRTIVDTLSSPVNPGMEKAIKGIQAGGPGSGRRPGYGLHDSNLVRNLHIAKLKEQGYKLLGKGRFPNGTLYHEMKAPAGHINIYQTQRTEAGTLSGGKLWHVTKS